jgi:glyoxylase-like metal-dependent hydrolase (beta-lactamase superfamily II)
MVVVVTFTHPDIVRIELQTPFPVGSVNAYLMLSDDARVLVDCGPNYDPAREALLASLASHGLQPEDITALVLTHGHVDHVGLASLFQSRGVPVYALQGVQTWLTPGGEWDHYRAAFFESLYTSMGVPRDLIARTKRDLFLLQKWNDRSVVDVELVPGQTLPWFPMYEVLHVPGHAQAALALWNRETGDILTGDQLLPHVSSNALIEPTLDATEGRAATRTQSLIQYRANLQALARMELATAYPGHGDPFQEPRDLIRRRLADQERRQSQFYELVAKAPNSTAFDIAVKFFPRHLNQLSLIMSETLGFLDWLEADGKIAAFETHEGVIRWRSTQ